MMAIQKVAQMAARTALYLAQMKAVSLVDVMESLKGLLEADKKACLMVSLTALWWVLRTADN